jgi:non-homologous end joining protein Ku
VPDGKSGEEAFAVIRDAMKDKGRVALARIAFSPTASTSWPSMPLPQGSVGTTLRYEVRDENQVFQGIPSPRVPKEMIELASHNLDRKAGRSI